MKEHNKNDETRQLGYYWVEWKENENWLIFWFNGGSWQCPAMGKIKLDNDDILSVDETRLSHSKSTIADALNSLPLSEEEKLKDEIETMMRSRHNDWIRTTSKCISDGSIPYFSSTKSIDFINKMIQRLKNTP